MEKEALLKKGRWEVLVNLRGRKLIRYCLIVYLTISLAIINGCGNSETGTANNENNVSQETELFISAAASLQEVLNAIEQDYQQKNPEVKLTFNFGSSGTLQRQIEQGAPVDIYISAGKKQMDELEKQDLIQSESRQDFLSNELALITAKDNNEVLSLEDLAKDNVSTIALGIPETVPVGQYTKEALNNLKLWDVLEDKFVMGKDVKQVLTYVETGNADVGFVYLSDAVNSDKVRKVESLSSELHAPIVYPAAIIKESQNTEEAQKFLAYFNSQKASEIFEEYGFKLCIKGDK